MPTPRVFLSTSTVDGIIYAIGGTAVGIGPGLPTVESYGIRFMALEPIANGLHSWEC